MMIAALAGRRPWRALATAWLAGAIAAGGCSEKSPPAAADAGADAARPDAPTDLRSAMPALDFTVGGCPQFDPSTPTCRGPAPLTVSFIPITSGNISRFLWDFGDLSAPSSEALPTHTYHLPGSYSVTVTGAPGQAYQRHSDVVVVTPNAFGDACDQSSQCDLDLTCLCGLSAACSSAFSRGFCSRPCDAGPCPEGGLCADLSAGKAGDPEDHPWRDRHCLRRCAGDGECPAGQRCRLVPTAAAPERWEKACFHGYPGDLGAACRSASGVPQNHLCLGGLCADLGALGVCSADCSARPCPEGTSCAAFNDGRKLCLRACSPTHTCREDPLLSCAAPGGAAPLAFSVAGAAAGTTFCAPKPCAAPGDCGPSGACRGSAGAAHCVRL